MQSTCRSTMAPSLRALVLAILLFLHAAAHTEAGEAPACKKDLIVVAPRGNKKLHRDFLVTFTNTHSVSVFDVKVKCGDFIERYKLATDYVVRRVAPEVCLLNDGKPIKAGGELTFRYDDYVGWFKRVHHFEVLDFKCMVS